MQSALDPSESKKGTSMWLRSSCLYIGRTQRETVPWLVHAAPGHLNCFFGEKREGWKGPRIHVLVHVEGDAGGLQSVQFSKPSRLGSACQANHAGDIIHTEYFRGRRNSGKNQDMNECSSYRCLCTAGPSSKQRPKMAPLP